MKKLLLLCTLLLMLTGQHAGAQLATTRLFNRVDQPVTVTYSASGEGRVVLDQAIGSIVRVAGYRKLSILLGSTKATSVDLYFGKISNATLSQRTSIPVDRKIHSFDVVGPEMLIVLVGGPPNTTESVQIWAFLST